MINLHFLRFILSLTHVFVVLQSTWFIFNWCILEKKLVFGNKMFILGWSFSFCRLSPKLAVIVEWNIIWRSLGAILSEFSVGSSKFLCSYLKFYVTVSYWHVRHRCSEFRLSRRFFLLWKIHISKWEIICFTKSK